MSIVQPLPGHVSAETAYVQADYPYGFTLRCQRRVWLERDPAGKKGYRLCIQTSNPKKAGLVWNAPKKSTYTMLAVMGLDEENHVTWTGLSMYDLSKLDEFIAKYGHAFTSEQASDAATMSYAYKAYRHRVAESERVREAARNKDLGGHGSISYGSGQGGGPF